MKLIRLYCVDGNEFTARLDVCCEQDGKQA